MAEKEKTSAATCSFSRFENHISIVLWAQTRVELIKAFQVFFESSLEDIHLMKRNFDFRIDRQNVFLYSGLGLLASSRRVSYSTTLHQI